jgi:ABC-type transport system involved in multi-copper enzyme maturation permease subunit
VIHRIWAIALNTFREAIRHRVLYGIITTVVGLNLFAIVLGEMSLGQQERVARDIGLAGVSLFGSITAIILGVSLLYGEIQRRTIHTIVSKPLERYEFVLGKYGGMGITLTALVLLFALAMAGLLALQDVPFTSSVVKALILSYLEVLVVAAIAVFFSSFASPFLSGIFTFALFFVGRVTPEMREAIAQSHVDWVKSVLSGALYIVPDLHLFSISGGEVRGAHVTVHGEFVDWAYVASASGYGALWIGVLLTLAIAIFTRRDFV